MLVIGLLSANDVKNKEFDDWCNWLPDMVGFEPTAAAYVADPELVRLTGVPMYVPPKNTWLNKFAIKN